MIPRWLRLTLWTILWIALWLWVGELGKKWWEVRHPACKVCHCGKTSCHRECSEENMCAMRCEGLCKSHGM